jgi:hypothetical protein
MIMGLLDLRTEVFGEEYGLEDVLALLHDLAMKADGLDRVALEGACLLVQGRIDRVAS